MPDSLINSLVHFFTSPKSSADASPEGVCGNCWGYYEYDGKVRQILHDEQIDVENHVHTRTFIKEFVATHVEGVRLRNHITNGDCLKCGEAVHQVG